MGQEDVVTLLSPPTVFLGSMAPRKAGGSTSLSKALPEAGTTLTPTLEEHQKGPRHFVREIPISALSSPC